MIDWGGGTQTFGVLKQGQGEELDLDQLISNPPLKTKPMNKMTVERNSAGKAIGLTISDLQPPLKFERVE